MIKVNSLAFSLDRYGKDRDKMYAAIAKQLAILLENHYVCKVSDGDCGIVIIEFEHDNSKDYWGSPELHWLNEDEVELVKDYRYNKENENVT